LTFFYLGFLLTGGGLLILINIYKLKKFKANIQPLLFSDQSFNWDVYNEVVRRIWLPFWENLFNNDPDYSNYYKTFKVKYTNDQEKNFESKTLSERVKSFVTEL